MACENLSKFYLIVMKISGHLPLDGDTSTIDFGPDRSIPSAGHAPKTGHNELPCSIDLKFKGLVRLYGALRCIHFRGNSSTRS